MAKKPAPEPTPPTTPPITSDSPPQDPSPAKPHGGARTGAGRPKGQGRFREPTRPVRVPESLLGAVKNWLTTHAQVATPEQTAHTSTNAAHADTVRVLPFPTKQTPIPNRSSRVNGRVHVPAHVQADVTDIRYPAGNPRPLPLPLYGSRVSAGFPSPADDYLEDTLDLNEHLITHPAATFMVRVSGDSMLGAGIHPGDILVVDRSLEATDGRIVIAVLDGELTVKRLSLQGAAVRLLPENPEYAPIIIREAQDFSVWGVVTSVIHKL